MNDQKFNLESGLDDDERFKLLFRNITVIMLYLKHKDSNFMEKAEELFDAHCKEVIDKLSPEYIDEMVNKVREQYL